MKGLKNRENRILLITLIGIQIIGLLLFHLIFSFQKQQDAEIMNQIIGNIIGEIKKEYPEIKEEEIIKILNNTENQEDGEKILKQYGIDITQENSILKLEEQKQWQAIQISIVSISIILLCSVVILYFFQRRNTKIEKLIQYIEQIMQKNDALEIENNTEDELTHLRNELYKITILLKEQADTEQKQRKQLSKSISDISHQLKTPLTSISIMLDNMIENPRNGGRNEKTIYTRNSKANRMDELVDSSSTKTIKTRCQCRRISSRKNKFRKINTKCHSKFSHSNRNKKSRNYFTGR